MSDYPMLISNKLHSFRNFAGQIWLELPIRMVSFKASLCSLMITFFEIWNIFMAAWYYKSKSKILLLMGILVWIYFIFFGHIEWMEFALQKDISLYDFYIGVFKR